ncbi:8873_t:CDS:2 [Diversispora eburnea]|uniref:8873_t:CDS:1 n=1 Tax=Diversispora eburnea TaxID=1213867 RepID=A0A9N8V667_9GLOM|nr:8873_t:CDS:2 [Diversispora eburnea]
MIPSIDIIITGLEILLEPFNYLMANPGKEIRSKFIDAFDHWLNVPKDKLALITTVVEMLHTASLLIDDVEDNSILRRGVPVAHSIYGIPAAINCANYIYFLALNEIRKYNDPNMYSIYTEELLCLHRGQGMELYWRDTLTCPTESEYIQMVSNKTGGLLRLGVKLMQEANILKQHTTSIDLKHFAVKLMKESGSFEYTLNYLTQIDQYVRDMIHKLGGNSKLECIMDLLNVK